MTRRTTSIGPGAQASLSEETCKCSTCAVQGLGVHSTRVLSSARGAADRVLFLRPFPLVTVVKERCRKCKPQPEKHSLHCRDPLVYLSNGLHTGLAKVLTSLPNNSKYHWTPCTWPGFCCTEYFFSPQIWDFANPHNHTATAR